MSFPKYPDYKNSGVEWLGEVPAHWFVGKVKHITSFFTGWTPPTGNADFYDGENPWANISDLGPKWLAEPAKRISDKAVDHSSIRPSLAGSLLFSFKLSIGHVSFAARDMYTNEAIATFPPSERLDLMFAYYALPFYVVQNASENIYGAKLLNQELIKAAPIAVPSIDEQRGITTFLDRETAKIDALVAEQEKLITLLQEKRQAVISHAVTKGLNPNVPMKDSGVEWLGEVPTHWEVIPAKRVASIFVPQRNKPDLNADGDGHFWVTMEQMHSEEINSAELTVTEIAARDAGTRILPAGAVVASCVGSFGLAAINSVDIIINQQLQAFIPNNHVDAKFLRHCVVIAKCYFEQIGTAATIAYVNQLGFANMPMPLPPKEEQHQIVAFLAVESAKFDTLMAEARTAITLLQERRTALISAAVTGQIDVRGLLPNGKTTPPFAKNNQVG